LRPGFLTDAVLDGDFLRDAVFAPGALRVEADFFLPETFFFAGVVAAFFPELDFPGFDFPGADFLLDFLGEDFFADLPAEAFFVLFFRPGFRAADFFPTAGFFFDVFLAEDRVLLLVLLTLRFFPEAFLPAAALRPEPLGRLTTARFRFLLAAFLAGMVCSCRSEKNAELYIG
jgi:hypothetical protein